LFSLRFAGWTTTLLANLLKNIVKNNIYLMRRIIFLLALGAAILLGALGVFG
jgi:hypothetical protein